MTLQLYPDVFENQDTCAEQYSQCADLGGLCEDDTDYECSSPGSGCCFADDDCDYVMPDKERVLPGNTPPKHKQSHAPKLNKKLHGTNHTGTKAGWHAGGHTRQDAPIDAARQCEPGLCEGREILLSVVGQEQRAQRQPVPPGADLGLPTKSQRKRMVPLKSC